MKKKFKKIIFNEKIILIFFLILVFTAYKDLFNSYFEADEWFHFTHYFPLTKDPWGPLLPLIKSVTDAVVLSEGQHVVPIGEEIFFLNTRFFGVNFTPYAFISILLHSINSFLVFLFIQELLKNGKLKSKNTIIAIVGGVFFALSAIPMHAVTWAAFYGQNVLSITFFILSILFFKKALSTKKKKYLFISSIFLLLDLLTKEIAVVLILIIPIMIFMEKRVFPVKFLIKIYSIPLAFFIPFRFVLPALYVWINQWIEVSMKLTHQAEVATASSGFDISLIIYRTISFPLSMLSQVFIPGATILSVMQTISPFIYYLYPGEPASRAQNRLFFVYGPGQNLLFYLISLGIVVLIIVMVRKYMQSKKNSEAQTVLLGFLLIIASTLPLVLNVLRIPSWGTDLFDSRHYYMPSIGAAIVFPFLLLFISEFIVRIIKKITRISLNSLWVLGLLFLAWFINNNSVFQANMHTIVDVTGIPRRQIITQLKQHLPVLPQKAVFYAETDGGGAYGTILPFQTSFPQILTIVYYDKNPLPDSFFDTFILDAKPQGYLFSENRGFGFYNTKKTLSEALLANTFSVNDVYGFYYDSKKIKFNDITKSVREEMENFMKNSKNDTDWLVFEDSFTKLSFRYPQGAKIEEQISTQDPKILKIYTLSNPGFTAQLSIISVLPTFDMQEIKTVINEAGTVTLKKIYFDTYHFNDAIEFKSGWQTQYFVKFNDKVVRLVVSGTYLEGSPIERLFGSVAISE